MRDILALALVRAELCRVYAAERPAVRRTVWNSRARAIIERTLRSIRAPSRSPIATDAGQCHAGAAASGNASPPD